MNESDLMVEKLQQQLAEKERVIAGLEATIAEIRSGVSEPLNARSRSAAQAPRSEPAPRVQTAREAASEAEATGKRADLLRYLRLKRRA